MKKNNNDCDIVQDLSSLYADKLVNDTTKKFIENHLSTCEDCKNYYNNICSDIFDNLKTMDESDKTLLNHLNKFNRIFNFIKLILLIIVLFILFVIVFVLIKAYYINNIVNNTYSSISTLSESNNYKITQTINYKYIPDNLNTKEEYVYYCYENKYKIESLDKIDYIEINDSENTTNITTINNQNKTIEENIVDYSYRKDFIPNDFYSFLTISNFGIGFSVKEDSVNSKNCFVLRKKYQNGYIDTYISKDDYMILRTVEFFENYYYKETNYLIEKNIVTNKNVDFSNKDQTEYKNYVKINSSKNN